MTRYKQRHGNAATCEPGFVFSSDESVALADRCCHQSARFRHRNVFLIGRDHLPLGKVVISKELYGFSDFHIVSVLAHRASHESADVTRQPCRRESSYPLDRYLMPNDQLAIHSSTVYIDLISSNSIQVEGRWRCQKHTLR